MTVPPAPDPGAINKSTPSVVTQPRRVFEVPVPQLSTRLVENSDWIDLYEILGVSSDASAREIEEAIVNRGADALVFAFARGYKPLSVQVIEQHQHEFRAVLLDFSTRRRYDKQRALHSVQDKRAVPYSKFVQTVNLPAQRGCLGAVLLVLCLAPVAGEAMQATLSLLVS